MLTRLLNTLYVPRHAFRLCSILEHFIREWNERPPPISPDVRSGPGVQADTYRVAGKSGASKHRITLGYYRYHALKAQMR
jgi:hypothetical protein